MKLVFRLLKIFAVVIVVTTVALFSASLVLQDKVAGLVLKSFNKKISTKYEYGSLRLSFLKKFPNANLDLKNVLVHSSPGFNTSGFSDVSTDTLLAAKSVSLEFNLSDIIKGVYNVEQVGIRDGTLILLTDTAGKVNYRITVASDKEGGGGFALDLNRVTLSRLNAKYCNLATNLDLEGYVENGKLKSRITEEKIDFKADGALRIDLFKLYNFKIAKSISTLVDVSLHDSGKGTFFDKSNISFDGYNFSLSGLISEDNVLDLKLSGDNIDISGISNYLPGKYSSKLAEYNPGGNLTIVGTIAGPVSGTVNPSIRLSANLKNGSVSYQNSAQTINGLSLDCMFSNGSDRKPSTSLLTINNLRGRLGSAEYSGSLSIRNFDNPQANGQLNGRIIPSELRDFFNLKDIAWADGSIDVNLKLKGSIPEKDKYSVRDFLALDPVCDMHFNSFGIGLKKNNRSVEQVSGDLFLGDSVAAKDLRFKYLDHSFRLSGIFVNLPEWILGDRVVLKGTAEVSCEQVIPEKLFPSSFKKEAVSGKARAFSLPGAVVMDLVFKIGEISYGKFTASDVDGTISYKPRVLNFKHLTFNSQDGVISGNGFVVQNPDNTFLGRGSFDLENLNVKKAFLTFNNFGQDFIKAENLDGRLSGTLSLLMPMDTVLRPVVKSVSAEGKYTLTDGSLQNFEPVKSLSSYIELSELENIRFQKLENDFFIKNNIVYVPQMDIISSAADFKVNGQHGFDNDYEYHIKILLSELLSKKLKKPKPNTTEFGAVKDDGLGRTSVVLKVEDKGDDVKVSYDAKAAGSNIKTNLKAERQNLRTILNQEFGWYKSDTATKPQVQTKSEPRFKITWDGGDTVKPDNETQPVKKESTIRNIFRKK